MARSSEGSIYIAARGAVFQIPPNGIPTPILKLRTNQVSMCSARNGGVWVIEPGKTVRLDKERIRILSGYPGGGAKIACAEDGAGILWLGLATGALLWRDQAGWHRAEGSLADLKLWDMTTGPSGDLVLITPPDIAIVRGRHLSTIKLAPMAIGTPWAAMSGNGPAAKDLFISGSSGLVRMRDNQLHRLDEKRFPWITWIRTLQQTSDGKTWLFSRTGSTGLPQPTSIARLTIRALRCPIPSLTHWTDWPARSSRAASPDRRAPSRAMAKSGF
ncbi:hypothetical protein [Sphingopyxis terrae]|uniref:hypothetical protein n=1 Tax=Sphingopyxis terrae TaxID=33052 RepID=UPI0036074EBD